MKTTLNLRVDKDLKDFLSWYAKENRMSVTSVITQYIMYLWKRHGKEYAEYKKVQDLSDKRTDPNA
jgi:hypothetical protein